MLYSEVTSSQQGFPLQQGSKVPPLRRFLAKAFCKAQHFIVIFIDFSPFYRLKWHLIIAGGEKKYFFKKENENQVFHILWSETITRGFRENIKLNKH